MGRKMDSKTKAIRTEYSPVSLHGYGVFALPKSYEVVCISSRHTAAKRTKQLWISHILHKFYHTFLFLYTPNFSTGGDGRRRGEEE